MAKETRIVSGIKVTVDPRIFMDWDFVMSLSTAMEGITGDENSYEDNLRAMRTMDELLTTVLGIKQKARVFDELRNKNDGYLPVEAVSAFLSALMAQGTQAKKSSGSPDASPSTETS